MDIEQFDYIWVRNEGDERYQFGQFDRIMGDFVRCTDGSLWLHYSISNPYDPELPCFKKAKL
jgi:hypothetical protein